MSKIPTLSYILDGLGAFGIMVGGYISTKSVYASQNSKQAAILIDTQAKRIDNLVEQVTALTKEVHKYRGDNDKMMGELRAYKKMSLVSPEIITKLTTTLDAVLQALVKDGIHIDTQKVDTQLIGKTK